MGQGKIKQRLSGYWRLCFLKPIGICEHKWKCLGRTEGKIIWKMVCKMCITVSINSDSTGEEHTHVDSL